MSEPIKPSLNDKEPWNEGGSVNFSAEDRRRRRSVVTGESEEVKARLRAKRRNTDDDAHTDRKHNDEDEDENVEIIGECRRWNYLCLCISYRLLSSCRILCKRIDSLESALILFSKRWGPSQGVRRQLSTVVRALTIRGVSVRLSPSLSVCPRGLEL